MHCEHCVPTYYCWLPDLSRLHSIEDKIKMAASSIAGQKVLSCAGNCSIMRTYFRWMQRFAQPVSCGFCRKVRYSSTRWDQFKVLEFYFRPNLLAWYTPYARFNTGPEQSLTINNSRWQSISINRLVLKSMDNRSRKCLWLLIVIDYQY